GAEAWALALAPRFQRRLAVTVTCASDGCDREIADAQRHLDSIAERIEGLETRVLDGDPRHVIIEEAKCEHADLIVIGKRGRNRIQEFLLGSTAEAIARDAHCPVLVVPQGA
ncbi:MAG: universal stress protein, partial [Halomonas sp.]|uniref:universal stress protein n=1 Tax=Halomonas sp. TaxID=1486246 RepID=UPI00286FF0DD